MKSFFEDRRNIYISINEYIKGFKKYLLGLGILKVLLLVSGFLSPLFFMILVDDVMVKRQINMLKWVCIGYTAIYIFETAIFWIQNVLRNFLLNKSTYNIRLKLWKIYVCVPITFHEKYNAGDLKNRIDTDVDVLENFINQQIIDYIYNWGLAIISGILLLFINWKLAVFSFLMVPVSFLMTKWLGKGVQKASEKYRSTWSRYENWLKGSIQGWKEVRALRIEKNESRIFTRYWHQLSKLFFTKQLYWYGNRSFIALKDFFITRMNLYFIGGLLIFSGELTIGSLLVFMKYYEQFFGGIGSINNLDMQLSNDAPAIERVLEILEVPIDNNDGLIRKVMLTGSIEFSNVSFKYNESQGNVLDKISFKINPKERIAIVGKSGRGKTTLIKLILRLHRPQAGNIFVDDYNINNVNSICLHQNIGVVMQDSILFNLSIRDNLLLAKPSATEEQIREACKMAYIHEFIESLPDKYKTLIGEKGVKLSGGQKQRLAIARVLLADPKIIIFDEATSSLDHESEKMIHKAIDNISMGKTVIIIAHRLSSVISADRVIVLENGSIAGDGHHSKLIGVNATYDLLFKRQYEDTKVL